MGVVIKECEHKFVHLDTELTKEDKGYSTIYTRIDRFYCEKCLYDEKKTRTVSSREIPSWWHNKE